MKVVQNDFAAGLDRNWRSRESLLLVLIASTGAILHYKTGDHGDSRIDSLLSGVILFWALQAAGTITQGATRLRRVILPAMMALVCVSVTSMAFDLFDPPAFFKTAAFDNLFPIVALFVWWMVATNQARPLVLIKVASLVAVAVSGWLYLWDVIAHVTERFLIETTIGGATQLLYWFNQTVLRSGDAVQLGTNSPGSVYVLLGCTGLPIFRLLLKIILVDSLLLGQKRLAWYCEAVLTAFLIMMSIGPIRVAVLTAAAAKGERSFVFWHGDTGIGIFSALGFLTFVTIVGHLRPTKDNEFTQKVAVPRPASLDSDPFST